MKSVMLILGGCVVILLFSAVIAGVQDFRSTEYTQVSGNVTTNPGITSANVTLVQDLFMDRNSEVESIVSSNTLDVPLVSTYTAASNRLLVTGLAESNTRNLTIVYNIANLADFWAVDLASRTLPLFIVLGVIGVVAASVYVATQRD